MAANQFRNSIIRLQNKYNLIRGILFYQDFKAHKLSFLNLLNIKRKFSSHFPKLRLLTVGFIPIIFSDSSKSTIASFLLQEKRQQIDMESLLKNADKLYQETDYKKIYNLLSPYKVDKNDEILWRLGRATFEIAKLASNSDEKQKLNEEAFSYIEEALAINPESFAVHKWMAILLDTVNESKGTKVRISQSEKVKYHIKKATELNDQDPTCFYLLGVWCFSFADLPWYQRKIASVIFATPPTSSYEEALEAFLHAEKLEPKFYSMNLLMLGKTYMKLGNIENALRYLLQVKEYPLKTEDDKQAQKEAIELLKSLGVST